MFVVLSLVPMIPGCRLGFDEQTSDARTDDAPAELPPTVLACRTQTRFSLGPSPARLAATATADGYNVVTVDQANAVRGFSYGFTSGELVARRADVPVATGASATGAIDVVAIGDNTLISVPRADGIELLALDARLAAIGPPAAHPATQAAAASLARSDAGQLGFVGSSTVNDQVTAWLVGADGVATSAPHPVASAGDSPSGQTIMPAGDDFLLVWAANLPDLAQARTSVVGVDNGQLVTRVPTTFVSANPDYPTKGAYNPRGAYAKAQRVYLIAWMLKYGVGDHIWGSLRTANMDPIGKPFLIGDSGNFPVVIAGATDFLVVWLDGKQLGAARVTTDQRVTPVAVSGSGDPVIGWDIVVRAGQPALVWAETDANDLATLRFDPLCN